MSCLLYIYYPNTIILIISAYFLTVFFLVLLFVFFVLVFCFPFFPFDHFLCFWYYSLLQVYLVFFLPSINHFSKVHWFLVLENLGIGC